MNERAIKKETKKVFFLGTKEKRGSTCIEFLDILDLLFQPPLLSFHLFIAFVIAVLVVDDDSVINNTLIQVWNMGAGS